MKIKYGPALKGIGLQFFAMKSLDTIQQTRQEILQKMADAVRANDTEAFQTAFGDLAENIQESVRGEFQELQAQQDAAALTARGVRTLTSAEQKYYKDIIEAMKSENPRQALTNINTVMPETVIDSVFEDIRASHPLLSAINFQNTGALVKILLSTTGGVAKWGSIDASITSELSANFVEIDLTLASLTAFIPVNRYMLDLGPSWLDRYVRELLGEAIAVQEEVGIVDGTGKDQPIGMDRQLTGATDGVYKLKTAVAVTDLGPATYGSILDKLAQGPNGKDRAVSEVILVVNPRDYFTKVFPATTVRAADGSYATNVFPFPTRVIQSPAVPSGKAVMGLASKYFMGVGAGAGGGRIEYSDEYKFLERQRVYAVFLYGYGRALDENAFVLLDISGMAATPLEVVVKEVKGTVTTKASTT